MSETGADCNLSIVGVGEKDQELLSLINELDLQSRVRLEGKKSSPEIIEIMKESDLYVQPSQTDSITGQEEAFGVVVLEAIAIGLPVIGSDSGGIKEIIAGHKQDAGLALFKQGDSNDLASKLIEFNNNKTRLSKLAQQSIIKRYSKKAIIELLLHIYE